MLYRRLLCFFGLCTYLFATSVAGAQTPALDFELTNDWWVQTNSETTTGNDGTSFTPKVDIQVTDLGFYDHNQDGLERDHTLSLYDFDSREFLASVNVGPDTTNLNGLFRYEPIAPITLTAGVSYVVSSWSQGGLQDNTVEFWNKREVDVASEIDAGLYLFTVSNEVTFPTDDTFTERFYFGPNFLFRTDAIDISSFDLNGDSQANCADVNILASAIASQTPEFSYDLNGDSQLDIADVESWLFGVGTQTNGTALSNGDANLDGIVDARDHEIWESNRFTDASWCGGDFSADGKVDGTDFNIWNDAQQTAIASSVPEPSNFGVLLLTFLATARKLKLRHVCR